MHSLFYEKINLAQEWSSANFVVEKEETKMALIKNEIPILEYDTEQQAILMPKYGQNYKFTEKAVMLFMEPEVEEYVASHSCEVVGKFESVTKTFLVYKTVHKGSGVG